MRALETIKNEIQAAQKKVKNTQLAISKKEKEWPDNITVWRGILAILFSLLCIGNGILAAAAVLLTGHSWQTEEIIILVILGVHLVFFAVLTIISLRAIFQGMLRSGAAVLQVLFAGVCVGVCGYLIYQLLQGVNPLTLLFSVSVAALEREFELPIETINKIFLYSLVAEAFVSLLVLIGALVARGKDSAWRIDKEKCLAGLKNELHTKAAAVTTLQDELKNTEAEAQRLFRLETEKDAPDEAKIAELAELDYEPAKRWLRDKQIADARAEGERIFKSELEKEEPDIEEIKRAAELGCSKAAMWAAKKLGFTYLPHRGDYAKAELKQVYFDIERMLELAGADSDRKIWSIIHVLSSTSLISVDEKPAVRPEEKDSLEALQAAREMKKTAAPGSEEGKFADFAVDALVKITDFLAESKKEREKRAAAAARQAASYSSSYSGSYSGSYSSSSSRPLTRSEMSDYLNRKASGLWNPGVVDRDDSLTSEQKEQMKDYMKIYGE